MAFPNDKYAPPGVYTKTVYENATQSVQVGVQLPIIIGTGSEILSRSALEVVRGSSSSVDQRIVEEDETGRSVVSISTAGSVTLGDFDGVKTRIQVRKFPIVNGNGTGTVATKTSSVAVTVNGQPITVNSMLASKGILELSSAPVLGDDVRVTYFFKRTDTQITEDLSDQVTDDAPVLYGSIGQPYTVITGVNDGISLVVDDVTQVDVVVPNSGSSTWSAAQVAAFINAAAGTTSLVAATATDNFGQTVLILSADRDLRVLSALGNSTFGLTTGDATARNKVFYTFQRPIVDGSNGGVTTTDPTDVVVVIDDVTVVPTSVDGATGAITLPVAPESGAVVQVTYYFNAWQETFDYLPDRDVIEVVQCGVAPSRSDFADGVDFVLDSDKVVWGTSVIVSEGQVQPGSSGFGTSQVSGTLVDARAYLSPCASSPNTSTSPPTNTRKTFLLSQVPTTGNGRNSPLGSDLYQTVSNGRMDLPTNRPDLVQVYWGFGVQDAMERGAVTVTSVDSATRKVTLRDAVPVGADVYATFYYNTLTDQTYTIEVESVGASGVGTYSVRDESGASVLTPYYGTKSSGLSTITLEFPSGSERRSDVRFEPPKDQDLYTGPVNEDVRVTFTATDSTLAKYTVPGSGDYTFVLNASDRIRVRVDGSDLASGAGGIDLGSPNGVANLGFAASFVGSEVDYDVASGSTTYEVTTTTSDVNLLLDGVLVSASAEVGSTQTVDAFVDALNLAAASAPPVYQAAGRFLSTFTVTASEYDQVVFHYTGDASGASGNMTATLAAATYNSPSALATQVQTQLNSAIGGLSDAFTGVAVGVTANGDGRLIFTLTRGIGLASTGTVTCATVLAGNTVTIDGVLFTADTSRTAGNNDFDMSGSDTATATSLVAAINDATNWVGDPPVTASNVGGTSAVVTLTASEVGAAGDGITLVSSGGTLAVSGATLTNGFDADTSGYLEFITHGTTKRDFCVLAGIDTAAATAGAQTKLVDGPVARRFTVTGDETSALLYDRIILRSRLVPGYGTVHPAHQLTYSGIVVQGGTGSALAGLTPSAIGSAGWTACVRPATLLGYVGFSGGQVPAGTYSDVRDGQPIVTFYASGGTTDQNNVLKITVDNVPVTVVFTDATGTAIPSAGSADVPLGPASSANTVLGQIRTAVTAAGLTPASSIVVQEGAALRLTSALSTSSSSVVVGTGNANAILGLNDGDAAYRTLVTPETLASALMAHSGASVSSVLNAWDAPSANYFASEALAYVVQSDVNAKYLGLQSQATAGLGISSSIAFAAASTSSVLLPVTGLGVVVGDGAAGESGISGFYVTSSDTADGSGTANTSVLNSGTGQDGVVGQTYSDLVTGLTFTVLARAGNATYPTGSYFTFKVRDVVVTDSNRTVNTIPGVELLVTSTSRTVVEDTALVRTFERGGEEPAVGDLYYVSYTYRKRDFTPSLFTKLSTIEAMYGALSIDNPITLAAYLMIRNGATTVAVKQVRKDTDSNGDGQDDSASVSAYLTALQEIEGPLPGNVFPNILVPLRGDSLMLYQEMAKHADIQSDMRHRAERTVVAGVSAGTSPRAVTTMAKGIQRNRFRLVYPDVMFVPLPNDQGQQEDVLVDGTYLAAMLVGSIVSPNVDVATPWTNRTLVGATQLARTLGAVDQDSVAVGGVTVIEDEPPVLKVRHGLTTDLVGASTSGNSEMSRLPTIVQISDEVNRRCRRTLGRFIGQKSLAGIVGQIEKQLTNTLKLAVADEIILSYGDVTAAVSPANPTVIEVSATIEAVRPLLYITITFNLKSQR